MPPTRRTEDAPADQVDNPVGAVLAHSSTTEAPNSPRLAPGPTGLAELPLELLDWIAALIEAPRDLVAFAATCKVFWTRWGNDWPLDIWHKYLAHRMLRHPAGTAPLFRFLGARRGQLGHLPFVINGADPAAGDGITVRATWHSPAELHHSQPIGTEEWLTRAMERAALSGTAEARHFTFDWAEKRAVLVSAPVEWIKENCACGVCADRRREAERAQRPVLRQQTLSFGPPKPKKSGGEA